MVCITKKRICHILPPQLYHDVENNPLLNDVFFNIFHHLHTFKYMRGYRVTREMDLHAVVHTVHAFVVSGSSVSGLS
jgi:hypothetical protein